MTAGRSTAASRMPAKCARCAAAEEPRDSTRGMIISPLAPIFLAWRGERGGALGILRARPDDDREAGLDETLDALHALLVGQQRPVAHRAAIDDGRHAGRDQLPPLAHQRAEIGRPVGLAGRHQRRDRAGEYVRGHGGGSCLPGRALGGDVQKLARNDRCDLARNAGGDLRIGTISAPMKPHDDRSRDFLDALGRPFLGEELFDRIADTVFFLKDRNARYVAVNETLVRRCNLAGKADLIGRTAREIFPAPLGDRFDDQDQRVLREGLSINGRLELHLYPDGRQGWCLTWKEPLSNRRERSSASPEFPATSRFQRTRSRTSRRCRPCSAISTTISTLRCAFPISRRARGSRCSSSISASAPCSAFPPANI